MLKQIGTKIYYDLITGDVIQIIGDMQGYVMETSFDDDVESYEILKERNKANIGLLQLEYGEYNKLSQNATNVKIDLQTKDLIFEYE